MLSPTNKSLTAKYYSKLINNILINNIYINFYDSFETFIAFEENVLLVVVDEFKYNLNIT